MFRSLFAFVFSIFISVSAAANAEPPITIGLIHFSPPLSTDMDFGPTLKHLQAFFAPRKVVAKVYQSPELEKAVEQGKIDFFFASSGFFYRMQPFGARDLATIVTAAKTKPNFGTAGVFFTRRDRKDISKFEDMKGKVLVANYETAFHGYRTGMAELENRGFNHEKFFKKVIFAGEKASAIINDIIAGSGDVGFVRACWLEEYELQNISVMDKLKVIGAKPGPIKCLHSTRAYPNNTFAATYKVDPELAREMTLALLSMKPEKDGQAWSIATDFKPVDDLYRSLKVGPYQYLREWSVKRVLTEFWPAFLIVILGIVGLVVHSWRAQKLVDRATTRLLAAEESRRRTLEKSRELAEKIEAQQKTNLVGQLSSMFAHEMNQPLAACKYFVDGLKALRKQKRVPDEEMLDFSLGQMEHELKRASQIVNKVRDYSKKTVTREARVDLTSIVQEITQTLKVKFNNTVVVDVRCAPDVDVEGDPVETEILFWNLLKNAMEESQKVECPEVWVVLKTDEDSAILTVENSGRKLSAEDVAKLGTQTFKSEKSEGLGLGLVVVRSILEAMNGAIQYAPRDQGGLKVTVRLKRKI